MSSNRDMNVRRAQQREYYWRNRDRRLAAHKTARDAWRAASGVAPSPGIPSPIVLSDRDIKRFWSRVDIQGPDACWPWKGKLTKGYGLFGFGFRRVQAHRVAYAITYGDPGELFVLHRCDYRPCSNPAHLFKGTQADNMHDMINKGRHQQLGKIGTEHHMCVLTESQVLTIRERAAAGEHQAALAREFGVHWQTVHLIVHRKNWKHI